MFGRTILALLTYPWIRVCREGLDGDVRARDVFGRCARSRAGRLGSAGPPRQRLGCGARQGRESRSRCRCGPWSARRSGSAARSPRRCRSQATRRLTTAHVCQYSVSAAAGGVWSGSRSRRPRLCSGARCGHPSPGHVNFVRTDDPAPTMALEPRVIFIRTDDPAPTTARSTSNSAPVRDPAMANSEPIQPTAFACYGALDTPTDTSLFSGEQAPGEQYDGRQAADQENAGADVMGRDVSVQHLGNQEPDHQAGQ